MTSSIVAAPQGFAARFISLVVHGVRQVLRPASHSRRAEAGRGVALLSLTLIGCGAVLVGAFMLMLDAQEITWMPKRGTAALWPIRILTDFGKGVYVLWALFALLVVVTLLAARLRGVAHATLVALATRVQFIFLAVLIPSLAGEVLKGIVGRGRPFVGGEPYAWQFSHFTWSEIYASFPSGHATVSCALAFAVSALWPKLRAMMIAYAIVIIATRLVLLAHHPSDVVGGALNGIFGAMVVRYWFASRRLAFVIRSDGEIVARHGPGPQQIMAAARRAFAA
jgi:undecaprenyl-diphosphatase